jgi:pSer/pThr/pTyr-binding forkhead associated (FHA) protein
VERRRIVEFWNDCGAEGPLEFTVHGGPADAAIRRAVAGPFAIVGRSPKADVVLDHEAISQHHLFVQIVQGRIFWVDLGSRTGVTVGGATSPMGWLNEGEAIGVGPFRLTGSLRRRIADQDRESPNPLSDRGPSHWPRFALQFPNRPGSAAHWKISRVMTLAGRGTDCRLRIGDDDISRLHCAFVRTPGGLWVVDLLIRAGVRLEGSRTRFGRLEPGVNLHLGRYRMIVRDLDSDPNASDEEIESVPPLPRDQLPEIAPRGRPPSPSNFGTTIEVPAVVRPSDDLDAYFGRLEQMQKQMFEQFHEMMMTMFQAFGSMHRDQMTQVKEELNRIRDLGRELQALQQSSEGPSRDSPRAAEPPSRADEVYERRPKEPWQPRDRTDSEVHDLICQRIAEIEGERHGRWKKVLELVSGGSGT